MTNFPAPSRINSAELPQRDVTVWEFAIFGYFPCIIRTVRSPLSTINIVKWRYLIFLPFFFLFLELGIFLFKLGKNILFGIGNTTKYRSAKRAKKTRVGCIKGCFSHFLKFLGAAKLEKIAKLNPLLTGTRNIFPTIFKSILYLICGRGSDG